MASQKGFAYISSGNANTAPLIENPSQTYQLNLECSPKLGRISRNKFKRNQGCK